MSTDFYLPPAPESVIAANPFTIEALPCRPVSQREFGASDPESMLDYRLSPWCTSAGKRVFDLVCVTPALLLISPLLGLLAFAVRLSSKGPIIFRQQRAGRHRNLFVIYKFRTMVENSESIGPDHTAKDDPRITGLGKFLRRFKLDELPQLYNVLRGDMSLVGPRPKLPHHDSTPMVCRPGVTGAATLAFRREQHILSEVRQEQLEQFYQDHVIPRKVLLDTEYMSQATLMSDMRILAATLLRTGDSLTHRDIYAPDRPLDNKSSPKTTIILQGN